LALSTSKKVVVQRFDRDAASGFVNPAAWLTPAGIELLTIAGAVQIIPYIETRAVFFVREFGTDPAAGMRRAFLSRPKVAGLWVRLLFRDGETLEAVIPNDLLQIDAVGLNVIPPDTAQRIWVPRTALQSVQVLSVMGSPLRRKPPARKDQIGLFEESA
jgi:hypothetical protein